MAGGERVAIDYRVIEPGWSFPSYYFVIREVELVEIFFMIVYEELGWLN